MVKYINWWDRVDFVRDTFFDTFFKKCCDDWNLDHNDITMYSVFGDPRNMVFDKDSKCKIYFTGENTEKRFLHFNNEDLIANYVNIVSGFFNSTNKSCRLPLWAINWNFDTNGLFEIKRNNSSDNNSKKVVLIARHDNGGIRNQISDICRSKGLQVDTNCNQVINPTKRIHVDEGFMSKKNTLQNYIFTICPENTDTPGYVTEKVFEAFDGGCIPIYWPNREIEKNVINNESILFLNELESINEINDEYIKEKQSKEVWKEDALFWIYMMYLELWSRVWLTLNTNKNTVREDCVVIEYSIKSEEEIYEIVKMHYLKYKNFYTPRMRFNLDEENKKIELEEWSVNYFKLI
jgi:hypothetical protein